MTERAAIIDVSRYHPAPGQREALLDVMRRMASKATSAEGCFGAQVCESDQDPEALADGLARHQRVEQRRLQQALSRCR